MTLGETAEIHGRHLVKPQVVFGYFFSHLVILGETAGTFGRHLVKPQVVFGYFFSQLVILGETAGILGRHLVKSQAVSGDLELLLQHLEPSYPDLAVNELLGELVAAC